MSDIQQIKAKLDIVDLVSQNVKLQQRGKYYTGFCPFHKNVKTPAFVVYPDTQTWVCFGECNDSGDAIKYYMKRENLDFREAIQQLAKITGVELQRYEARDQQKIDGREHLSQVLEEAQSYFRQQMLETKEGKKALDYIRSRHLSDETIKIWGLGYAPAGWDNLSKHFLAKGYKAQDLIDAGLLTEREDGGHYDRFRDRLMFPIRDATGKMAGFGARTLNPDDVPKYLNSPKTDIFDKGTLLYGMDLARSNMRALSQAVIVEGYMDVIALHQAGYKNTVASMGTALTEDQFRLLKRTTRNIVLALDADKAGQNATLRGLETARSTMTDGVELFFDSRGLLRSEKVLDADIRVTTLPEGTDPDEIANEDPEKWRVILDNAKPIVLHVMQTLAKDKDLQDAKVKREIATQVLPLIEEVGNPVERESYRQNLANMLAIDVRALSQPASTGRRRRQQPRASYEPVEEMPVAILPSITNSNRLKEMHCITYIAREPNQLNQINRQLAIIEIPPLSEKDFQEADCKFVFETVQASLLQDLEPATEYVLRNIEGVFNIPEKTEEEKAEEDNRDLHKPSDHKTFLEHFKTVLRIRKSNLENRSRELQFMQSDDETRRYTEEEASILFYEIFIHRHAIDAALASPVLPEIELKRKLAEEEEAKKQQEKKAKKRK